MHLDAELLGHGRALLTLQSPMTTAEQNMVKHQYQCKLIRHRSESPFTTTNLQRSVQTIAQVVPFPRVWMEMSVSTLSLVSVACCTLCKLASDCTLILIVSHFRFTSRSHCISWFMESRHSDWLQTSLCGNGRGRQRRK